MLRPEVLPHLLGPRPDGVDHALDLLERLDLVLARGLARTGPEEARTLTGLTAATEASPVGHAVGNAVGKILAGAGDADDLTVLAGARTAVLGAVHDALLAQLDAALGRARPRSGGAHPPAGVAATHPAPATHPALAGCRAWLQELAVVGWHGVDHDIASGGEQVVAALLAEPTLRRPAVLLDGLTAELQAASPIASMTELPARRWADLWARALLLTRTAGTGTGPAPEPVTGRLLPLGVDVQEHPTAVQLQVHGLLEPASGGPTRLVRWTVGAGKVDTVTGPGLWQLFADRPVLLHALARGRSVEITDLPLHPTGDLVWDERRARPGEAADPFTVARVALADATGGAPASLDRHPVHLREPVLVEDCAVATDGPGPRLRLGDHSLAVDLDHLPSCGPLTAAHVTGADACLGLLRHDGREWVLQPLTVRTPVKRRPTVIGTGEWALGPTDPKVAKALARTGDTVGVLRERAGRLLRA